MENSEIQSALPRGTVLHGANTYVIEEVLGIGGFGITYLAVTEVPWLNGKTMRRRVAVKEHFYGEHSERGADGHTVSTPGTAKTIATVTDSLDDFLAEAQRLQKFTGHNANIVKVFDVFRQNDTAYYVMEYLEGLSLGKAVVGAPIDEAGMLSVMRPIIATVAFLHRQRINHLDIKPDNIVLADGGTRPVLIDFGQSKHFRADGSSTSTIKVKGATAGYAPAEQYEGIRTFSPAADVYALGATMMTCLTGKVPPTALSWQPGAKGRAIDELPASDATKAVIARALASDPAERYADAGAMLAALADGGNVDGGTPTKPFTSPYTGDTKPLPLPAKERRSFKRLIFAAIAPLIVAAGLYFALRPANGDKPVPMSADTLAIAEAPAAHATVEAAAPAMDVPMPPVGAQYIAPAEPDQTENERIEAERIEAERRAEQERIDRENQVWDSHRTPVNLYLAVTRGVNHYYFSESDWNALSSMQRAECTKRGVVIDKDGQRFILELDCVVKRRMTWNEAMNLYSSAMPTMAQGEAISSQWNAVNSAIGLYGGSSIGDWFWTKDADAPTGGAWVVSLHYGIIVKDNAQRVRRVEPI